jgi:oligosaccharide repeat unit polymerase
MVKHDVSAARAARSRAVSTALIVCGLTLTGIVLPSDGAVDVFTVGAFGVGLSLGVATLIEAKAGIRNLIRVDILILWALFGLTFLEFLFPQPNVDALVSAAAATNGTHAMLVGFAGLAVGRHLVPKRSGSRKSAALDLRPAQFFLLFMLATVVGYLHIFLAVDFNPFEALRQMSLPRWSQSWSRGQYGNAYSLLYELGALIYLIPPIAGLMYARSRAYDVTQKVIVGIVLVFTFYYGFASGTRNVFATYVITFIGVYFLAKRQINWRRALLLGVPMIVLLLLATVYMLKFRTVGLSNFSIAEERTSESFFVDLNMVNVSLLTEVFPNAYGFLGLEIPYNALIRPIPRALWSGKPEALSVSIETALGVSSPGMTVSCTFVGEAYMAGGLVAVLVVSLFFGAAAEMWNRVRLNINSQFTQLLYASGFLCAALAMRSMLQMVPLVLPTLALWLFAKLWASPRALRGARSQ